MTAAVVSNAAITFRGEEEHLVLEGIGAERPPVTEDHGLPSTPILVIDLGAVLGGDGCHFDSPFIAAERQALTPLPTTSEENLSILGRK
jgi:hypothetical protein